MSAAENTEVVQTNYLEMSDEDILKAGPPADQPAAEVVEPTGAGAADDVEQEAAGEGEGAPAGADKDDAEDKAGDAKTDEAGDKPGEEGQAVPAKDKKEGEGTEAKDPKDPAATDADKDAKAEAEKTDPVIDYEAIGKQILKPFKANGREVQVKSVDDAIALMQMGANYNKKMAALKPNLKLMKTLENHGLMSEEQIGFLIDLSKKDPAAINKLVKDSGIDPLDLTAEKASAYKQTAYAVDDREMELDTVLEEIASSPVYTRTLDVVSNKWDAKSKKAVAEEPQLLKVINDHVERGIYDLISTEMESERVLGRLNGLSDIEAYRQVGDALNAKGAFNHLGNQGQPKAAAKPEVVQPKPKVDEAKLNEKRRAASSTKPTAAAASNAQDFNPLAMSDEDFSKLAAPKFG